MTAERFRQIRNVFDAAMDQPEGAARAAWLAEACQGDPTLRDEVSELLRQHEKTSGVLDEPAVHSQRLEGRRLGPWEILREIGRGGMGAVYLARRADGAFQMQAAIKVLNAPFASEEMHRRFQQEREILAQLSHPNIARLLDGGETDNGQPYLVMEYVNGKPLTEWCDDGRASIGHRLELLEQLCSVVQYLHQNKIIHRDLKPANVLVDGEGRLKLLDFGISKLLGPVGDQTVLATRSGLHLLTPEYASPEQVMDGPITPQTDIYALGVIAYEVLAGRRPYQLRSRAMHAIMRAICEDEPERPSTAVTESESEAGTVGRLRQSSPEQLSRRLRGLDDVVMKALRKEPRDRYRSAEELALDLSAQRDGRAVSAHGDSPLKRIFQWLSEHRVSVILGIAGVLVVLSGAVTIRAQAILFAVAALLVLVFCYLFTDPELRSQWTNAAAGWKGWFIFFAMLLSTSAFLILATVSPLIQFLGHSFEPALAALMGVLLVFQLCLFSYFTFRQRWAGKLLVDGRVKGWRWYPWFSGISALVMAGIYLYARANGATLRPTSRIQMLYYLVLAMFARFWFGTQEFRQRGVVIGQGIIRWDKIRSWSWETRTPSESSAYVGLVQASKLRKNAVLRLDLRTGPQHGAPFRLPIPPTKVDAVSAVLDRYLGEWPGNLNVTEKSDSAPNPQTKRRLRFLVLAVFALDAIGIFVSLRTWQTDYFLTHSVSAIPAGAVMRNPADGLAYVWIPAGSFRMGCSEADTHCASNEKPPHEVTITHPFWIGKAEVPANLAKHGGGHLLPTRRRPSSAVVNWHEAQAYCESTHMRLPTEAEWEYAARAGTTDAHYGFPESIVRTPDDKIPLNHWGLSQMLGLGHEWVADALSPSADIRILRGFGYRVSERSSMLGSDPNAIAQFRCAGEPSALLSSKMTLPW